MIFGHLLTGTNFNDSSTRLTGGSHGYGAKLTNIFSQSFEVEIYDSPSNTLYTQKWADNMTVSSPPIIEKKTTKEKTYTKITFEPDLSKFPGFIGNADESESSFEDILTIFHRRTIDIAGCLPAKVSVYFNNDKIPVSDFKQYANLFVAKSLLPATANNTDSNMNPSPTVFYCKVNDRWEVVVLPSFTGTFESISFVNNVWTSRGGSHVTTVASQIISALEDAIVKKGETKLSSTSIIKNKLMIFVNSLIENPSFEGQTKDALITKSAQFGSSCVLKKDFLADIVKNSGVVEWVLAELKSAENSKLMTSVVNKSKAKKLVLDIPKLEDAHLAGTDRALECTLILTEGDSAKALAVAGLEVVGRDTFGVFPLKG